MRLLLAAPLLALLAQCDSPTPADITSTPDAFTIDDARWEGTWEFSYSLQNLEGVSDEESQFDVGSQIRRIWEVTPQCETGPCNVAVRATDPDDPIAPAVNSTAIYDSGVYRVTESFAPIPEDACRSEEGKIIPGAFNASNSVEVMPTEFEVRDGRPVVTEAVSTKQTSFTPTPETAELGGTCVTKTAMWEGPVLLRSPSAG